VRDASSQHPRESADGGPDSDEAGLLSSLTQFLLRNPRDSLVGLIAAAAISAVFVNGLFLQPGPHPAPIFTIRPSPVASSESTGAIGATLPRPRPAEAEVVAPQSSSISRNRTDLVSDIQKELTRRGFYDGAADGVYGAKTDAAIRDFEHAANLRPSLEPNEALLQSIARSSVKASPTPVRNSGQKNDAIAGLLGSSRQLVAIQRALSDFGYGPLKATGAYDADTRAAVERFERDRKMPITGQISERLTRELAATTGRPLE
jgi:peptidoglycan hydrolase-like protein with peptidoglycan-binding domain